ncbi:MAG TPA: lysyl oxidase family protein [Thermoleophilaceae bacterium]|nr:lysyl oxidase family protein [Thermoleophilaceae bacterium]
MRIFSGVQSPARAAVLRVGAVSAALAACLTAIATGSGTAQPHAELLPDLDQGHPRSLVVRASGPPRRPRYRLGFTSTVNNSGRGPLEIRSVRERGATMRADQAISLAGGGTRVRRGVGSVRYVRLGGHQHWHLLGAQRFRLLTAKGRPLRARVAKQGLCFGDREPADRGEPRPRGEPVFTSACGRNRPGLKALEQGISPGYADPYPPTVEGQELDITRLPAGRYQLVHRADPLHRLRESDEDNNAASVAIVVRRSGLGRPRVAVVRVCAERARCDAPAASAAR